MLTDYPELPQSSGKNIVVFGNGQYDRSPCGTGTSARISSLYSKGMLKEDQVFTHESVINTVFKARVIQETKVGPYDAIIPEVTGRAFVTQLSQLIINPNDILKNGFSMLQYSSVHKK
jgi:proline racemase